MHIQNYLLLYVWANQLLRSLTISAAGDGPFEGARCRLPGLLLGRGVQRARACQLNRGRSGLRGSHNVFTIISTSLCSVISNYHAQWTLIFQSCVSSLKYLFVMRLICGFGFV